jgi:hypothetical protein
MAKRHKIDGVVWNVEVIGNINDCLVWKSNGKNKHRVRGSVFDCVDRHGYITTDTKAVAQYVSDKYST